MKKNILMNLSARKILFLFFTFSIAVPVFSQEERIYISPKERLEMFSFEDEDFSIKTTEMEDSDGSFVILSRVAGSFKKKYFDSLHRLQKVEKWKMGNSSRDSRISSIIYYFYKNDSENPYSSEEFFLKSASGKLLSEIKESDYEKLDKRLFDESGYLTKKEIWQYKSPESPEKNPAQKIEKEILEKKIWKFDGEHRLTEETDTLYRHSVNQKNKKITESSENHTVWNYNGKGKEPDSRLYENGKLRMSTIYTSSDTCTERTIFDDGFEMIVLKENGIKKSETVYAGGKIMRQRIF